MRPALLPAMALAFAGCGPSGFSQLGEFQLRFMDASTGYVQAQLDYDRGARGCQTLGDDFTADANGNPASISRGGGEGHLFAPMSCSLPAISFTRPAELGEGVLLVANAGPDRLTVQVDGVGEVLTGVPLVTPGEVIHVGQRIQLQLGAGWERVNWPAFGGVYVPGLGGPTTVDLAPPTPGGVLEVQLPSDLPAGEQHVLVNLIATPTFSQCEGPAQGCRWDQTLVLQTRLDVPFQVKP